MIADMARMSGEPGLQRIVASFLKPPSQNVWRRLVDENAEVREPPRKDIERWSSYQLWIVHALAPDKVPLARLSQI